MEDSMHTKKQIEQTKNVIHTKTTHLSFRFKNTPKFKENLNSEVF